MKPDDRPRGLLEAVRTAIEGVAWWLRRLATLGYSALMRESIPALRSETERLGAAAVESVSHVGAELRALDERLTGIEQELASLRRALEQRAESVSEHTPD